MNLTFIMIGIRIIIFTAFSPYIIKKSDTKLYQNDCAWPEAFIQFCLISSIHIMSCFERLRAGMFSFLLLLCGGGVGSVFCEPVSIYLSWSIRCDVELVWSCYKSYMAKAVGNGKVMAMGEAVSGYVLLRAGALSEAIYYIYKYV